MLKKRCLALAQVFMLSSLLAGGWFEDRVRSPKNEAAIYEDDLNTADGLRWAGPKLPYRKTVDIKDSLVGVPLGKVAADRHGIGSSVSLFDLVAGTFAHPVPGRAVYISLWGSKIEGCFVEIVVQLAPNNNNLEKADMVPTLLELGIGSQLLELPPQTNAEPKLLAADYRYFAANLEDEATGTWYMTRNTFVVDSSIAQILSNAPASEVRARLTMLNGQKILIPINKKTVASWKTAYAFNPSCQSPEKLAQQKTLAGKPLLKAFAEYSGSPSQTAALGWLQTQISKPILAEFTQRWRGADAQKAQQRLELVNAAKFYQDIPQQQKALEWLEGKLTKHILDQFLQKWAA